MPKVKLTAKTVENATAPVGVQVNLFDATLPAFGLRVGARRKTWFLNYRWGDKQHRLTLGHYPEVSLADARAKAGEALAQIDSGRNPATPQPSAPEPEAAPTETFAQAVEDFMAKYAEMHQKRPEQTRWFLEKYVLPTWRDRMVGEVRKRDVLALLDGMMAEGKGAAANRVFDILRKLFNWRLERSDDESMRSPCDRVKSPAPSKARSVRLDGAHIVAVWRAAEEAAYPWGPLIKLLLLTGQRRGEVASMRWGDLDLTGDRVWKLAPDQTKASRAHIVPLSQSAIDIIKAIPRQIIKPGEPSPFVFTTIGERPVSGFGKAKERLDKTIAKAREKAEEAPLPDWRVHDIRRTVTTGLSSLGVPEIIKERILNHSPRGVTQRHYDQYEYLDERREALERWAEKVMGLVRPEPNKPQSQEDAAPTPQTEGTP
jgi:integrase